MYEVVALIVAGGITIHGALRLFQRLRFQQRAPKVDLEHANLTSAVPSHTFVLTPDEKGHLTNPPLLLDAGWLAVGIGMLLLWPECLDISLYPRRSFLFFAAILATPLAFKITLKDDARLNHVWRWLSFAMIGITAVASLIWMTRYLLFVRPRMEGPDFYYYVCTARHLASNFQDLSIDCYFYFPGVYTFWRIALALKNASLTSLQWCYFGVMAANTLLVGAVIQRVMKNTYASIAGMFWYLAFCSRFDGFIGATEPIATLPALAGLLIWSGQPFTGPKGLTRLLALGIGLGLSVYTRQQAGLIALGVISLFATYFVQDKRNPIVSLRALLLLPAIATVTLIAAILPEGHGLQPLWIGTKSMPLYGMKSNFWTTVWHTSKLVTPLAICTVLALLFWFVCLATTRYRRMVMESWFQVLAFTVVGGLFSLLPFGSRAHLHYGLIAGPMLIIASVLLVTHWIYRFPLRWRETALFRFALIVLILFPFIQPRSTSPYFYVWPFQAPVKPPQLRPWRLTAGLSSDLETMKKHVQGENIYVLPPRQNDVHFFTGSRHQVYGWAPAISLQEVLRTRKMNGVIVIEPDILPDYVVEAASEMFDYDRAPDILKHNDFAPDVTLKTMTLWRKK